MPAADAPDRRAGASLGYTSRMMRDRLLDTMRARPPPAQVPVQQALAAAARLLAVPDLAYAVAGLHRPVLLHIVGQAIEHGSGSSQRRKADSSGSSAAVGAADAALAVALVRVLDLAPHAHRLNCTPSMNQ